MKIKKQLTLQAPHLVPVWQWHGCSTTTNSVYHERNCTYWILGENAYYNAYFCKITYYHTNNNTNNTTKNKIWVLIIKIIEL